MKSILLLLVWLIVTPTWAQDAYGNVELQAARERLDAAARALAELHRELGPEVNFDFHRIPIPMRLGLFLGRPGDSGIEIMGVTPAGPAAQSGLESGDLLATINGQSLTGGSMEVMREIHSQMSGFSPGDYVHLDYVREGQLYSTELRIRDTEHPAGAVDVTMAAPAYAMGSRLHDLDPGLGRYFGVESGVLVLNGGDDPAGLMPGDVITDVEGVAMDTQMNLFNALHDGHKAVTVYRDGGALVMTLGSEDLMGGVARMANMPESRGLRFFEMRIGDGDFLINPDSTVSSEGP